MPDSTQPIRVTFDVKPGKSRERALAVISWFFGMTDVPIEEEDAYIDEFYDTVTIIKAE